MAGEYIICYDIKQPKRLGRIHRALKKCATALQYSVFLFTGSPQQLRHCLDVLEEMMDTREDDIRVYPLPGRGLRMQFGKDQLPDGILWAGKLRTSKDRAG